MSNLMRIAIAGAFAASGGGTTPPPDNGAGSDPVYLNTFPFETVGYTGNGFTSNLLPLSMSYEDGVDGLIISKSRSAASGALWTDTKRGATNTLDSSSTAAQVSANAAGIGSFKRATQWFSKTINFGAGNTVRSITVAFGLYIAVGDGGKISTSPVADGTTWTARSNPFGTTPVNSIAFNGTRLIAVANTGLMAYSTNGTSWTAITGTVANNTDYSHKQVRAMGSLLILASATSAIGLKIHTSTDNGTTWVDRNPGSYVGISYGADSGNGRIVVGYSSGNVLVSSDSGATWAPIQTGANSVITAVRFLNGLFYAGTADGRIFTSSNGLTWNQAGIAFSGTPTIRDFCYARSVYIAVCNSGVMYTSVDGANWTYVAGVPTSSSLWCAATDGKSFMVGHVDGGGVMASAGLTAADNVAARTYVAWAFKKQAKFFDVVTYTANGTSGQRISHDLGVIPGLIIIKNLATGDWMVWAGGNVGPSSSHTGMSLSSGNAATYIDGFSDVTSVDFTAGSIGSSSQTGSTAGNYVAYLWANDQSADSIIKCGEVTVPTANAVTRVELGFEPQFMLYKNINASGAFCIADTSRGVNVLTSGADAMLFPGITSAESSTNNASYDSTGFNIEGLAAGRWVYMAIRKPINSVPTVGTQVFAQSSFTGTNAITNFTYPGWSPDMVWGKNVSGNTAFQMYNRMRGFNIAPRMTPSTTAAAAADAASITTAINYDGYTTGPGGYLNPAATDINYAFRRAAGFFDMVTYLGDANGDRYIPHQLGVKPELVICKAVTAVGSWYVTSSKWMFETPQHLTFEATTAAVKTDAPYVIDADETTVYAHGTNAPYLTNNLNVKYEVMLFGTVVGVSKVGVYFGNGATTVATSKKVDCGFSTGARFVMIKRTDAAGEWWIYDTARGIVSGAANVALKLGTTSSLGAAMIDPYAPGFAVKAGNPDLNFAPGALALSSVTGTGFSDIYRMACGNGWTISVGDAGQIGRSLDGKTFSRVTSSPFSASYAILGIASDADGKFLAINANGDVGVSALGYSGWTLNGANVGTGLKRLRYVYGKWIATFSSGLTKMSTDGITWSSINLNGAVNAISMDGKSKTGTGTLLVVISQASQTPIVRRNQQGGDNPVGWESITPAAWSASTVNDIAYNNGVWCVLFSNGLKSVSTDDGATWTTPAGTNGGSNSLNAGNGAFWLAGQGGGVSYSYDGITWTSMTLTFGGTSQEVVFNDLSGHMAICCTGGVFANSQLARYLFLAIA